MNSPQFKNAKSMLINKKPFTPPNHPQLCHLHHRRRLRLRLRHGSIIPYLPKEILQEIFNKVSLPIKTIFEFQTSTKCKELSSIFSDTKFVESQANHYTLPCVLAYDGDLNKFFLIEGRNGKFVSTEINVDFIVAGHVTTRNVEILSSCNGLLILLSDRRFLWVVNPLTREIIALPIASNGGDKSYYVMGFSSKSDKYKVVRLVGRLSHAVGGYYLEFNWYAEVLTLGGDTWRRINGCDHVLQNATIEDEGQVMINDALYWLIHLGNKQEIVRFEIDSEEFEMIPSPLDELGLRGYKCSMTSLGVVDGMLCVTLYERRSRRSGNSNDVDLSHGMEIWVWRDCRVWEVWKKINLIYVENVGCARKFDLIKVCENDEEVLMMLHDPLNLVYYDTNKHTIREARIDGVDCKKIMKGVMFCPNLRSIAQCIHFER